jgi:hypothetical protein
MWRLAVDHPMMLEGIDGLLPGYGGLVAIQNGSRPRRIIQIRVKPDGTGIESYRLGITVPADGGEPTLGTFDNYTLLYVADSQWERYGPGGAITDGQPPRPTPIRKTGFGRPPVALR